ncbi:3-methylornithyl-N6-L-lysine dehydrogenase PylD [Sporomusa acidovorans]|uniref:Pyrrolysine biosynthesis protein PylD n=1 Tax=Sporomusa acidovorans (strain ATCC 49682 / DSM 3132 / Mol) TaxID=1123286 RepID=A0ABZ3IVT1_SPOA4|nr:3-methylornithyl-N6-L-lysine dehydrogenase PylD [Sporomusa acidovorans]OZC24037.1 3-methylornithyl-N6-L-lysine dehydrogenase [Sporomusa acidovorans DSM 3132]SDF58300.1 pyrrolysine biosynthesis protein PylD [Sporomusa acidovorans]
MTRLREEDICLVGERLSGYDSHLLKITGSGLAGIAAHSLGKTPNDFVSAQRTVSVGVIPVTYGQGIISGFSETVRDIIAFLGFAAFVTREPNLGGLAEAVGGGAKIVFLADDDNFIALNVASGKVSDNGEATGRGYAAALELMAGGLREKKVLIIGAGPVGCGAARYLTAQGAKVLVHDCDESKMEQLKCLIPEIRTGKPGMTLPCCQFIVEATPAENTVTADYITADTCVAAPGIPLGLNRECRERLADRLIHDVLEIGVATMLFTALAK